MQQNFWNLIYIKHYVINSACIDLKGKHSESLIKLVTTWICVIQMISEILIVSQFETFSCLKLSFIFYTCGAFHSKRLFKKLWKIKVENEIECLKNIKYQINLQTGDFLNKTKFHFRSHKTNLHKFSFINDE